MKQPYTKIEKLGSTDIITGSGTTINPKEYENIYFGFWEFE